MPTYWEVEEWRRKLRELTEAQRGLQMIYASQQAMPAGSVGRDSTMSRVEQRTVEIEGLSSELRAANIIDEWGELTRYARDELDLRKPRLAY